MNKKIILLFVIILLFLVVYFVCSKVGLKNISLNSIIGGKCSINNVDSSKLLNVSVGVDEYTSEIWDNLVKMRKSKISGNCSDSDIVAYILEQHPLISQVTITPSGSAVSFYRIDEKGWENIGTAGDSK